MKVTIITAVWNGAKTIATALESVARQQTEVKGGRRIEIEHIVVDGGSTDGTVELVRKFADQQVKVRGEGEQRNSYSFRWISEKDKGLYDAIDKGIKMATGDVIGICNADDILAADDVIVRMFETFERFGTFERLDCVYGKIRFVNGGEEKSSVVSGQSAVGSEGGWPCRGGDVENGRWEGRAEVEKGRREMGWPCRGGDVENGRWEGRAEVEKGRREMGWPCRGGEVERLRGMRTVRRCFAKLWRPWMLQWGYMPPHPGVFIRRACFEKWGGYVPDRKEYKIAADYELLIRYFRVHRMRAKYSGICTTVMRTGGVSTRDVNARKTLNEEIIKANRTNGYFCCWPMLLPKYAIKIWEVILPWLGFDGR